MIYENYSLKTMIGIDLKLKETKALKTLVRHLSREPKQRKDI